MAQAMMNTALTGTAAANAAYNRQQAMLVWGTGRQANRLVMNPMRVTVHPQAVHPQYVARRKNETQNLAHQKN